MDESLAQYAVAVFIGSVEGEEAYTGALGSYRRQYEDYVAATGWEKTQIGLPVTAYPDAAYRALIYERGPLFFGTLADQYGYDQMIRMLQDYYAAYHYRIAEPEDMLNRFETTLGEDLAPFFEEWVGGIPVG
jgi:aminopeptidase N